MGKRDFFGDGSCVCWYEFNDNANDTGGGNHGTPTDVTYAESPVSHRCAVFNGSSSRIMLPTLLSDTSIFTVSVYINSSASVGVPIYFGSFSGADALAAFGVFKRSGNNFSIVTNNTGANSYTIDLGVSNLNWDHVVGVLTSTSLTAYLNGEPVGSITTSGTRPSFHAESNLGGNLSGGSWWFNGMLDEFRVFNRALTHGEVVRLGGATTIGSRNPTPVILSTMPAALTRGFR